MDTLHLETELIVLEQKLRELLEERNVLKQEIVTLKKDKEVLREAVEKNADQINNFQNQIKISKIVDSMAVEEDTAELKIKINEYIKDIDKCIALLSK